VIVLVAKYANRERLLAPGNFLGAPPRRSIIDRSASQNGDRGKRRGDTQIPEHELPPDFDGARSGAA
jgi:hypothetical protein